LYFASLPNNWTESEIKDFHQDFGVHESEITGCKLLPPRHSGITSRAAIVKYASHAAAERAMNQCRGGLINMEVRYAEERAGKGAGQAVKGKSKGGSFPYKEAVPVEVGLRVRNRHNSQTGEVVATNGRTPGTFRVLMDNGQEWEWETKRFVTADGWAPLHDRQQVPATINMRIKCWMDNRTGRIAYIHNIWPQRIWVEFDDGEEGEKDVTWFVSEDTEDPVGPGMTRREWSRSQPNSMLNYQREAAQVPKYQGGYSWQWGDRRQGSGEETSRRRDSWETGNWRSSQESWNDGKGYGQGAARRRTAREDGESAEKLEEEAIKEAFAQLADERNNGRVWIIDWPSRFQPQFGELRDFLSRHPDKFTVIPQVGRRYTVALAGQEPPADAPRQAWKAKKPSMKWQRAQQKDGDTAGGGHTSEQSRTRSARRGDDDPDATAFDADEDEAIEM